jgi:hypothetical protein
VTPGKYTDAEVAWISERVRFYIRKSFGVPRAIERALCDFRREMK